MLLLIKIFEHTVVSKDLDRDADQVVPPFLQSTDDRKEFFFMYWIIELGTLKLLTFKGDWTGGVKTIAVGEDRTGTGVASVAGDEDFIGAHIVVVDYSEAFMGDHKTLDGVEGTLVLGCPKKIRFSFLRRKWSQEGSVLRESWEEIHDIADKTKEGTNLRE